MKFYLGNRVILDTKTPLIIHSLLTVFPDETATAHIELVEKPLPHTTLADRAVVFINNTTQVYTDDILEPFFNQISYFSSVSGIKRTVAFLKQCYNTHKSTIALSNDGVIGYVGLYQLPETKFYVLEFILNPAAAIRNNAFNFLKPFLEKNISPGGKIITVGYNSDVKQFATAMDARALKKTPQELINALTKYYPDISRQTIYMHP